MVFHIFSWRCEGVGQPVAVDMVRFTKLTKWDDAWVNLRRTDSEAVVPDHYPIQKKIWPRLAAFFNFYPRWNANCND